MKDDLLWEFPIPFEDASRGYHSEIKADDALKLRLAKAFGMITLHELKVTLSTTGLEGAHQKGRLRLDLKLWGEVTQECGVSLEPFRHEIESELSVECIRARDYKPEAPKVSEHELRPEDLDEPDVIDTPHINLGLYFIEALGEAYDPFARAPGVEFVEPEPMVEPSPFAVLAQLKPKSEA